MSDREEADFGNDPDVSIDTDEIEEEESVVPAWLEVPDVVRRLHRALGPLAGGLILDFMDLATFGPLGVGGFFIGAIIGWWITSIYGFSTRARIYWAIIAGVYCLVPFTEFLPVATIISAIARYNEDPDEAGTPESDSDPIDVEAEEPDEPEAE